MNLTIFLYSVFQVISNSKMQFSSLLIYISKKLIKCKSLVVKSLLFCLSLLPDLMLNFMKNHYGKAISNEKVLPLSTLKRLFNSNTV